MELWRLEATHHDGHGQFVRFYAIDHDMAAETAALERLGWLCDCDRESIEESLVGHALIGGVWPVRPISELRWLAGDAAADARQQLSTILDRKKKAR